MYPCLRTSHDVTLYPLLLWILDQSPTVRIVSRLTRVWVNAQDARRVLVILVCLKTLLWDHVIQGVNLSASLNESECDEERTRDWVKQRNKYTRRFDKLVTPDPIVLRANPMIRCTTMCMFISYPPPPPTPHPRMRMSVAIDSLKINILLATSDLVVSKTSSSLNREKKTTALHLRFWHT